MLKRKYADRSEWKRIVERRYVQKYIETDEYKGHITLLELNKVAEPLHVQYEDKKVCIVDEGYIWLQHFPDTEHFSLTTMFDSKGKVVQWYIDICLETGVANNVPWMDDLFLDLVVFPSKVMMVLDSDELDDALDSGVIDERLHRLAWNEVKRIKKLIDTDQFKLFKLATKHKNLLLEQLNR